jgi:hypothetical protein
MTPDTVMQVYQVGFKGADAAEALARLTVWVAERGIGPFEAGSLGPITFWHNEDEGCVEALMSVPSPVVHIRGGVVPTWEEAMAARRILDGGGV